MRLQLSVQRNLLVDIFLYVKVPIFLIIGNLKTLERNLNIKEKDELDIWKSLTYVYYPQNFLPSLDNKSISDNALFSSSSDNSDEDNFTYWVLAGLIILSINFTVFIHKGHLSS